jgi:hypothetical protein
MLLVVVISSEVRVCGVTRMVMELWESVEELRVDAGEVAGGVTRMVKDLLESGEESRLAGELAGATNPNLGEPG